MIAYRPDIVLLQESPSRSVLEDLSRRLFGDEASMIHGPDASLIVRGQVTPADLTNAQRSFFVQGRVHLASGEELEVISTRLRPALLRLDLWSPSCWRAQKLNRQARRQEMRTIARRVAEVPQEVPILVGGDFNAPAGDAVFRLLQPFLRDAFHEEGRGWGNTITNTYPVQRIDQIWISDGLRPLNVVARPTDRSDHRMVVCEFVRDSP